jgi:hypothetical protein
LVGPSVGAVACSDTVPMEREDTDLIEKIERCRRLANFLTDEEMRQALEELADDYEARLKRRWRSNGAGFMLRDAG